MKPLALTALFLLASQTQAADTPPPAWPTHNLEALLHPPFNPEAAQQTTRVLQALASPDFQTREQASKELVEKGFDAFPGIFQAALSSNDAEVRARLELIKKTAFQFPLPPNLPTQIITLVHDYQSRPSSAAKKQFFSNNYSSNSNLVDDNGELFLRLLLQLEDDPDLKQSIQKIADERVAYSVRLAAASGNLNLARQMLANALPQNFRLAPDFAAFLAAQQSKFNPDAELTALLLPNSDPLRNILAIYLYTADGNPARASEFPLDFISRSEAPRRAALIAASRFNDLLDSESNFPHRFHPFDPITTHFLQGNPAAIEADLQLAAREDPQPNHVNDNPNVAKIDYFLLADHPDQAIDIARSLDRRAAFHLLAQQLRLREALALFPNPADTPLEIPRSLNDLGFPAAARAILSAKHPVVDPAFDGLRDECQFLTELERAGLLDQAADLRRRIFNSADPNLKSLQVLSAQARPTLETLRALINERDGLAPPTSPTPSATNPAFQKVQDLNIDIGDISKRIFPIQLQCYTLESSLEGISFNTFAPDPSLSAIPNINSEASYWFDQVLKEQPLSFQERHDKTLRILHGTLFDTESRDLINILLTFASASDIDKQTDQLESALQTFHRLHNDAWIFQLITRWFQRERDPYCWALLGNLALDNHQPALAITYFQQAASLRMTDAPLMTRLAIALSRNPTTRAAGSQLLSVVPSLVLADSRRAQAVADTLRRFDSKPAADPWLDHWLTHYGNPDPADLNAPRTHAIQTAESQNDFAKALELQKQALFSPPALHPEDFSNIMANLALYHRLRALVALQNKDTNTLIESLNGTLNNGPPDIDLFEKTLPTLQKSNPQESQNILQKTIDRLTPLTQDYPEIQKYQNQLKHLQTLQNPPPRNTVPP